MKIPVPLLLLPLAGVMSAPAEVTDNLVAYWDFEAGTANHSSASGGTAYDGTLMGDAGTGGVPKVGAGALSLDGAGDYLDVAATVDVNLPWTVSAWFRADVAPTGRGMVFESSGSYSISYGIREGSPAANTNFQAYSDTASGSDPFGDFQVEDAATANTWHHILLAFTPATATEAGSVTGYLDGVQTYSLPVPAGMTLTAANGFHVGTYRAANDRWFDGSIDEVAIWDRTLGEAEAIEVHSRGSQGDSLLAAKYSVVLSAAPAGQGTVGGTGVYDPGDQVPVSAVPNPGYVFLAWDGDFAGEPASFTYTATADAVATATFGEDDSDPDGDGLSNYREIVVLGTLPDNPDTDGDRIPDGAEADITSTDPKTSDAELVAFVEENLCPNSHAGAIALAGPRIERDPSNGLISLFLGISGSADQQSWLPIGLDDPSVSITPVADGWDITIPAPSTAVDSYILMGRKP